MVTSQVILDPQAEFYSLSSHYQSIHSLIGAWNSNPMARLEFVKRLSLPFNIILISLVGYAISIYHNRFTTGRLMLRVVLVIIVYYVVFTLGESVMEILLDVNTEYPDYLYLVSMIIPLVSIFILLGFFIYFFRKVQD